jgi:hypothetical protein
MINHSYMNQQKSTSLDQDVFSRLQKDNSSRLNHLVKPTGLGLEEAHLNKFWGKWLGGK